MRYTVRTPDGELAFSSRQELQQAVAQRLVGLEDEVREEGGSEWRRVGTLAGMELAATRAGGQRRLRPWAALLVLGLGGVAFWMTALSGDVKLMLAGALLAFGLVGLLFGWTRKAFQVRRRD